MRVHIIWNGRSYKQDDAAVLAELQKSGYIDANKALKEYLATQGLDFDGAENVFYRDKDGNLMVTDAFLTNVLGGDRNGHYWLNDN